MTSKLASFVMAAAMAGVLALAPAVFAQGTPPPSTPSVPNDQGMMNGHGMMNGEDMMGGRGGTMGMMGMMSQMTHMMRNCNQMMENWNMGRAPGQGSEVPPSQGHNG